MAGKSSATPDASDEATITINATLAALPADQRATLQALREAIAAAAPEAVEAISYAMPAFRYHGRALVSYAGWKAHCSLYPMSGAVIDANRTELAAFDIDKGTIRFTPDDPLPAAVVTTIVRARMAEIDAARSRR
jgi:uncharacterized protein YdhG (YjbR/CyaY superfamily)